MPRFPRIKPIKPLMLICLIGVFGLSVIISSLFVSYLPKSSEPLVPTVHPQGVQVAQRNAEGEAGSQRPATIAMVVEVSAKASVQAAPQVVFAIKGPIGRVCPTTTEAHNRLAEYSEPGETSTAFAEGRWCMEIKPGQPLEPRPLEGVLFDLRSDSEVQGETRVESLVVEAPGGQKVAVTAGAVRICDEGGQCAVSAVVERGLPTHTLRMRLPLTAESDVIVFGPREQFGSKSEAEPYKVKTFSLLRALVNEQMEEREAASEQEETSDPLALAIPDVQGDVKNRFPVFEDDSPEVNRFSEPSDKSVNKEGPLLQGPQLKPSGLAKAR